MINPLITFTNKSSIPSESPPEELAGNIIMIYAEGKGDDYAEWYDSVPKKFNWNALKEFGESFLFPNLFWLPVIIFLFLAVNYKRSNNK